MPVYVENWPDIAESVKTENNYHCERCKRPHAPKEGYTLTVHHLDGNPQNNKRWNLAALCQRCHLSVQSYFNFAKAVQPELFDAVPLWLKHHVEGYKKDLNEP